MTMCVNSNCCIPKNNQKKVTVVVETVAVVTVVVVTVVVETVLVETVVVETVVVSLNNVYHNHDNLYHIYRKNIVHPCLRHHIKNHRDNDMYFHKYNL